MKNLDFSGRLGELRCPTLILCGEKDGANLKSARFLAGHIPGAELQVLENTGHVVNEENPRALAERLNAFYGRHRLQPGTHFPARLYGRNGRNMI